MPRRSVVLASIVVAVLGAIAPARAEVERIGPPFDDAWGEGYFGFPFCAAGPMCRARAFADVDGAVEFDLAVTSADGGRLPSYGSVYGYAQLRLQHVVEQEAREITYTISYRIAEAHASIEGSSVPIDISSAGVFMDTSSYLERCGHRYGCYASDYRELVGDRGTIEDETDTVTVVLRHPRGDVMQPGTVDLVIWLYAHARLGTSFYAVVPDTGTVEVALTLDIGKVTAELIE